MESVNQDTFDISTDGEDLFTDGLHNCIGIAILYEDSNKQMIALLTHSASPNPDRGEFKELLDEAEKYISDEQLPNVRVVCVGGNYDNPTGRKAENDVSEKDSQALRKLVNNELKKRGYKTVFRRWGKPSESFSIHILPEERKILVRKTNNQTGKANEFKVMI